ncbi:MAG: ABC transporter permease [Candidatus Puniceispirillaceae bacterium]
MAKSPSQDAAPFRQNADLQNVGRTAAQRSAKRWLWRLIQTSLCVLLLSPIAMIAVVAVSPAPPLFAHLFETVLAGYLFNTIILMMGVGLLASLFGISSAWVVSRYDFKGRALFDWLLVLPAAIPAYIIAYAYTDFLEYAGPIQTLIRDLFGFQTARDYWFFEIRSMGGAIVMMAAVLYPYIYLMARTAFRQTSRALFEQAQISGRDVFFDVGLPLARPAIFAGLALVLMEVVSDFGTVDYFAIDTLTLGIFNVWLGMNNMPAAAQLSLFAFIVIIGLLGTELYARSRRSFQNMSNTQRGVPRIKAAKGVMGRIYLICLFPIMLGFVIPVGILVSFLRHGIGDDVANQFGTMLFNNLTVAAGAGFAIILLGVVIGILSEYRLGPKSRMLALIAATGYAIPGTILAIGVLGVMGLLNQTLAAFGAPYLSGGLLALMLGYMVRFHAVGYGAIQTGLGRVPRHVFEASQSLGKSFEQTTVKIVVPILSPSLGAGLLLVFVDVMKELPMTLLLRPFQFETFATFTYQFAKDEMIAKAALPALMIVLTGLVPVILLNYSVNRSQR